MRYRRAFRCSLAWLLLAACGDNIEGIKLADLEASRRAAECERLVRCNVFDDEDVCTSYFRRTIDPGLVPSVDSGRVHYDPVAAAACNSALAARSCDVTTADGRALPEVCAQVLRGTLTENKTCAADRECQTGRCDAMLCPRDTCCYGGCEPYAAPAALGEACTRDVGCATGAFCARDATCHPLSAVGEACEQDVDCVVGLACIGATELDSGACRALPKLGEACPYGRCAEIGARCDGSTCVAYGHAGDPCTDSAECSEFRVCDPAGHRCIDTPMLGEPCTQACAGESWCDFSGGAVGTCRAPSPNAAPCDASDECASRFCLQGPIFDQCEAAAACY